MSSVCKVAILIDGGFFLQRFKLLFSRLPRIQDIQPFLDNIMTKVNTTTPNGHTNVLHRTYYYDCRPFAEKKFKPDGTEINFAEHPTFRAATQFQNDLKTFPQLALRLGELSFDGWKINKRDPTDIIPDFKQKSVDIKIGLDIAWMAGKRTVDKIVLVTGDSDFVVPMKFARKEGLLVYLHSMAQKNIKLVLVEHADFIVP